MPAIAHSGVTCQRCHGEDVAHANGNGHSINPVHLSPESRDAICMECHLERTVAINRPGKHLYDFKPGDTLNEYIRYFALKDKQTEQHPALSQVQALAQSVCKQKSGDRMSCVSCHDPHSTPTKQDRVAFYRSKCLGCHGQSFADRHHASESDCTACHMPFTMGTVIAHTQTTDHRILRRPPTQFQLESADNGPDLPRLVPFPDTSRKQDNERELALAWESLAEGGMQAAVSGSESSLAICGTKESKRSRLAFSLGLYRTEAWEHTAGCQPVPARSKIRS